MLAQTTKSMAYSSACLRKMQILLRVRCVFVKFAANVMMSGVDPKGESGGERCVTNGAGATLLCCTWL